MMFLLLMVLLAYVAPMSPPSLVWIAGIFRREASTSYYRRKQARNSSEFSRRTEQRARVTVEQAAAATEVNHNRMMAT